MRLIDSFLDLTPNGAKIFDLGAGKGEIAEALARKGWVVIAVDQKPPSVQKQSANWILRDLNCQSPDFDTGRQPSAVLARNICHLLTTPISQNAIGQCILAEGCAVVLLQTLDCPSDYVGQERNRLAESYLLSKYSPRLCERTVFVRDGLEYVQRTFLLERVLSVRIHVPTQSDL